MRKLEDLKTDLLNNKLDTFYIFFGEDVGIRRHYIDKINTYFDTKSVSDNCNDIKLALTTKSLFSMRSLFLVYNDDEFAKLPQEEVQSLIERINGDYACILVYDNPKFDTTNLYKNFEDYCTEFQAVQPIIAREFVEDELDGISEADELDLAYNCDNLYSNILLETDKVKQYQQYTNTSQQNAYDTLKLKNQMLYKEEEFSSSELMNNVLQFNRVNIARWCDIADTSKNLDVFIKCIFYMFNDFLIAGLCKKYGKYDGSSRAYKYGLSWGRALIIRDFDLKEDYIYYFNCAYRLAEMDRLIKNGSLERPKVIDYFLTKVI